MHIKELRDDQLLAQTKILVQSERDVLTKILHHLREIDRRKLYCDLGYGTLFDYAVKELKYGEGQAGRRIQAMRLIKELPQIEKSIASGELSLSNVAQAQSLFRNLEKKSGKQPMSKAEKLETLASLKNKSTREGQKELLKLQPLNINPKSFEKERQVTPEAMEVRFLMSDALKAKLEKVRALLGPKAIHMGYGELIEAMADCSAEKLSENRFGKKRVGETRKLAKVLSVPAQELGKARTPTVSKNNRYIPKSAEHAVWTRDNGRCVNCGTTHNLNFDHILPVALGGESTVDNLRLLCFHCNQRQGIKVFGLECMRLKRP